jgi:hypothetical protein
VYDCVWPHSKYVTARDTRAVTEHIGGVNAGKARAGIGNVYAAICAFSL